MVEGLAWLHILLLPYHQVLTSCPSCLSHQELVFYAFTSIATGLSQNMVNFHMSSFILYEWWADWSLEEFLHSTPKSGHEVSWICSDRTLAMNMNSLPWYESPSFIQYEGTHVKVDHVLGQTSSYQCESIKYQLLMWKATWAWCQNLMIWQQQYVKSGQSFNHIPKSL